MLNKTKYSQVPLETVPVDEFLPLVVVRHMPPTTENTSSLRRLVRAVLDSVVFEGKRRRRKRSPHPAAYRAPEGSPRDKKLDATKADLESGDPERIQRAYDRREKMEKTAREAPGWKNRPRPDTKAEGLDEIRTLVAEVLAEALSKKTKATLRKKAEKRGLTPGSVEAEYKKGLAAWATSGSRPGMSQHQWAMARVNAATPSKSWATVKKSKRKKKKKD